MTNSLRWQPRAAALHLFQILVGFGFVGVGISVVSSVRVFSHSLALGLAIWAVGVVLLGAGVVGRVRARSR
jgi:hypothetical protein